MLQFNHRQKGGVFIALLFILCISGLLLFGRYVVPLSEDRQVFSTESASITGTGWKIIKFRPVHLFFYRFGNSIYSLSAFRDGHKNFHLVRIFLGGSTEGTHIPFAPLFDGKSYQFPDGIDDFNQLFSFREQVEFTYVIESGKQNSDAEKEICDRGSNVCPIVEKFGNQEYLNSFKDIQRLSFMKFLPALEMRKYE